MVYCLSGLAFLLALDQKKKKKSKDVGVTFKVIGENTKR